MFLHCRCVSSDHLNALDMDKEKSKPVQRSSSLKTPRVNSRDEWDQCKSWTPIELPNLIRRERESTDLLMDNKDDIIDHPSNQGDSTTSQSSRQRSASVSDTEDDRTVLVKCGSDEIPLLPGLVKRQAQGNTIPPNFSFLSTLTWLLCLKEVESNPRRGIHYSLNSHIYPLPCRFSWRTGLSSHGYMDNRVLSTEPNHNKIYTFMKSFLQFSC